MISTTTNYSLIILFLLFAISLAISFYFYKNSPISKTKKYLLLFIKSFSIFLILVLFIEPSMFSEKITSIDESNVILVDNSRSNELPTADKTLKENQIKKILANDWNSIKNLKSFSFSNGDAHVFSFAEDSMRARGFETNLIDALASIKKLSPDVNLNSITIISDGCFNSGGNPLYRLREFNCPVFTFGIGDTIQQKDILIENLVYNEKAFTNTKNVIKVIVSAYDFINENITVNLKREGVVIATKIVKPVIKKESVETEFDITESKTGIVKYQIVAETRDGEVTFKNNSRYFLIKYIDNKVNILYLSAGPGYDNSFILEILKRVSSFNLVIYIHKNQTDFYEGKIDLNKFGELSLVFLLGFPTVQTDSPILDNIISMAKDFKIPVVFFAQKNTDYKILENLNVLLPFSINRSSRIENLVSLRSTGNEILRVNLPPFNNTQQIFKNVYGIVPKPGSVVLATDKSDGEPILLIRNTPEERAAAFLAYGLWRWKLNEKSSNEKIAENLVLEIINETISKEKKEKLNIIPAKSIFDYTENISINAQALDINYHPMNNAKISANIFKNGEKIASSVEFHWTNNEYTTTIHFLPPGDYLVDAQALVDNVFYASNTSRFLVDTITTEYLDTKSDFGTLKTISQNTGGAFFNEDSSFVSYKEMLSNIGKKIHQEKYTSTLKYDLWENKYVLMLIVFLLSFEWFLRKRNNLF